ncbi:MAG: nucleotide sugar dehydrogenase [Actinomycetota bacterium]
MDVLKGTAAVPEPGASGAGLGRGEPARRVAVWGAWHLGAVVGAGLASLGHQVTLTDLDDEVVTKLRSGRPAVHEPGLEDLLREQRSAGRLEVAGFADPSLGGAEYTVIALDVAIDDEDRAVLDGVHDLADAITHVVTGETLLVVMSQVPVGTSDWLAERVAAGSGASVFVAHVPENLRLGSALATFFRPDRIVVGADDDRTLRRVSELFAGLHCPVVSMSVRSAEMAKHALNAYLATCISFIGEVSELCEQVGADAIDVAAAMRLDRRVSPHAPLAPGLGYAGGTLGRDVQSLRRLGSDNGVATELMDAVMSVNRRRIVTLAEKVASAAADGSKAVALLGLTYKPGTDTLRRSQSLELARLLVDNGMSVRGHDPMIGSQPSSKLGFPVFGEPYEAAAGAEVAVLMTEWPEYRQLDLHRLASLMARPVLIDPGGFLDEAAARAAGFRRRVLGRA